VTAVTTQVWRQSSTSGFWARRGRTDLPWDVEDGFELGTTRPNNSSVAGTSIPEASLTPVGTGAIINLDTPGQTYSGKIVNGSLRVRASNVTIEDCIIDVPAVASERHGIYLWTAGVANVTIRRVTIRCRAVNQSYLIGAGIHGAGFDADRVEVWGMTDGVMMAGIGSKGDASLTGSWIHDLPHYAYDGYPSKPGSHSNGSHPDGVQVQGNLGDVLIQGNDISTARTSCIIITNGSGTCDTIAIDDNWFPVGDVIFGSFVNLAALATGPTLAIRRNRFPVMAETPKARMYLSTALLATADLHSTGSNKNVFLDGTSPVPVYNGSSSLTTYN
jgi:hypothetical protein